MSREGGDWMCNACEHMNFKKRDACQRCRCPRYAGANEISSYGLNKTEVLAGDWYCNAMNCGAHNYASRTNCYRCGSTRDGYCEYGNAMMGMGGYAAYDATAIPGWKNGDWLCARLGCGVHNYACRMECFKCKSPRDFGDAM